MNDGTIISIFFARIALHGHGSLHWGIYFYMPRFISGARELWSIHIMALSHTHCLFQNPMLWHHDPILSTFWTPAISSLASSEVCWCSDLWKHFNNLSSILALHKCALQDWFYILHMRYFPIDGTGFPASYKLVILCQIWPHSTSFNFDNFVFLNDPFYPFHFLMVQICRNIVKYQEICRNMKKYVL